ncbi:MAG: ATP-binding cassette domain-containing protein, partial [Pseudomonadota bacterium]
MGPSGCGKSTALKAVNRMHDDTRDVRITGTIEMYGKDVMAADIDAPEHRSRFGWVAQKPNPFVMTIYDNVAYRARIHGMARCRADLDGQVENDLRKAMLWDEVKDDLHRKMGNDLSGGQQQRLCVARAFATQPEVFLMDEPTGSIDPVATERIEDLLLHLR